ncbi:kinase-like domain-containing protein [Suillus occidentalis]|nr:kinase-like domain-containing protein [Suillus occidentalis]
MVAQDLASNRLLCLKVFRKDRLKDMITEDVILDELDVYKRLASSMPCPASNFLMGLEFSFQTKYEICFAMDLMTGDLFKYMMRRPSFCFKNACRWTAQIALGINALHQIGIIHRDIKPENILIDVRENVRIADYGLCYIDKYRWPLDRQRAYTASAVGTTCCMAPEVLRNIINLGSKEYGTPVDWWSLGCVVYQLVSKNHRALFYKKDDILDYASWCSSGDRISRQHPIFEDFPPVIAELLSGLLNPNLFTRYGFPEVVQHRSFMRSCGKSEFSDAHSRAREREALPILLPDLQHDQKTAEVWHCLAPWERPRVPNVDWVKPTFFSFS